MEISFDPEKRRVTLEERGLDFRDADKVFEGRTISIRDERFDYAEPRFITAGKLDARNVVLVWTPTAAGRRIISMRYAHAKEIRKWRREVGGPGRRA